MDHLPWHRTDQPRPRVPYLCGHLTEDDICSNVDEFVDWPQKQGWEVNDDTPPPVLAVYCQSWLFFGIVRIITEAKEKKFSLGDYVTMEDPPRIDTSPLEKLLCDFPTSVDLFMSLFESQRWMSILVAICGQESPTRGVWKSEEFNVLWSAALLNEQLLHKLRHQSLKSIVSSINKTTFVVEVIRSAGKCPYLVVRAQLSLLDTWTVLSTPLLPDSYRVTQKATHSNCIPSKCRTADVVGPTYPAQHASICDTHQFCGLMGIDTGKLKNLVRQQVIPLVRSTVDPTGIAIEIVDGTQVKEFTAVSHVWAGGLGNSSENKIYECQVIYLHQAIRSSEKVRSIAHYWLDTLCVPVDDDDLRKQAIDDMAHIYASANRTLVLDPALKHTSGQKLTRNEQASIIAASAWMTRSWTFQEGSLAVNLDFQFHDAKLSLSGIESSIGRLGPARLPSLWHRDVDRLDTARPLPLLLSPSERLASIWGELSRRSTTQVEDLAAIIAVFIDRSAGEVLGLESDQRVHALLRSQTHLPTSLLFVPVEDCENIWRPKLPKSTYIIDSDTVTSLQFSEESLLEISDLRDLYILRSPQVLPCTGVVMVHEQFSGACFEVTFPGTADGRGKQKVRGEDALLIFPRQVVDQSSLETATDQPGICFVMKPGTLAAEHAHFRCCFRWRRISGAEQVTILSDQSAFTSSQRLPHPVALFPSPHTHGHPAQYQLVLDMGVQNWKGLSWSRKQFYPLITRSIQYSRISNAYVWSWAVSRACLFSGLVGRGMFLAIMICFPHSSLFDMPPSLRFKLISLLDEIVLTVVMYLFSTAFVAEKHYVEQTHRVHLQKTWASSFRTSDVTKLKGLTDFLRQGWLGSIYFTLLLVASAVMPLYWSVLSGRATDKDSLVLTIVMPLLFQIELDYDSVGIGRSLLRATALSYLVFFVQIIVRNLTYSTMILRERFPTSGGSSEFCNEDEADAAIRGRNDTRNKWFFMFFFASFGIGFSTFAAFFGVVPFLFSGAPWWVSMSSPPLFLVFVIPAVLCWTDVIRLARTNSSLAMLLAERYLRRED